MRYTLSRWASILLLAAFGFSSAAVAEEYQLQPGDIIEITVLEDSNLNRRLLIGPDGNVSLPLAGTVKAGDRSLSDVQNSITDKLRDQFVSTPSVTVSLVALAPPSLQGRGVDGQPLEPEEVAKFFIIGEVRNPGRYDYKAEEPLNILQALTRAGGPGTFAARSRIQIRTPQEDGTEIVTLFDYEALEDGDKVDPPVVLEDGAIIVVPERGFFD